MQEFKTIGEKILKLTPYGCRVEGEKVVMTIGRAVATMDYETAIKLAAYLRYCGRLAKKAAGDLSLKATIIADLTDANADELQAAISKDRKSVYARR
jgi:hypothetical protein